MQIELRPRGLAEVKTYFEKTADPEIAAMLPRGAGTLEEAVEKYYESQKPGASSYGKVIIADGRYVGDVWCYGMEKGGDPEIMLSFCVFEKSLWGKGAATKAVGLFLEEVREKFGLETAGAFCYRRNRASLRVLEKNGFALEETFVEEGVTSCYLRRHRRNGRMLKFETKLPLEKGWSCDQKYCAVAADGTKYLLRVTPEEKSAGREDMFHMQQKAMALGVPMCRPVEFGRCEEGVYIVQTWIDGQDAEEVIPYLADSEQYAYGLEAGRILKEIHSIPAPADQPDWESRFNAKMDRQIELYRACPIQFDGAEYFIAYIEQNRHLLKNRPQCFQHGDYHIGNMMLENGKLVIIDFDRDDFGDPWEEFNRIVWCAQVSPLFASGMINGYFEGEVPRKFWELLALYISSNMLSSLPWAVPFGEDEINTMQKQAKDVLKWYDNMRSPVPSWYFKGYYLQYIDGLPYKLKSSFDFGFMRKYGKVFKVFDDQDSGNICFGAEKDGQRYFVKFAGAPTERGIGTPEEAIERLKATVPVYSNLRHKNLIEFVEAEEIGGGFAMVFKWVDGDCMGRMYPAAHRRFMSLSADARLAVFRDILDFLEYIASQNYVAIDFYDGSILYDFASGKTTVCDIDFFRKQPCVNDMGRMWGSSRFQAPEEYELGAVIDEVTNVYTVGATAFALFGDYNRTMDHWQLSETLFKAASKAVSDDRLCRQQSIRQFRKEWEAALEKAL